MAEPEILGRRDDLQAQEQEEVLETQKAGPEEEEDLGEKAGSKEEEDRGDQELPRDHEEAEVEEEEEMDDEEDDEEEKPQQLQAGGDPAVLYGEQVARLLEMGYDNLARNVAALVVSKGDITGAIAVLNAQAEQLQVSAAAEPNKAEVSAAVATFITYIGSQTELGEGPFGEAARSLLLINPATLNDQATLDNAVKCALDLREALPLRQGGTDAAARLEWDEALSVPILKATLDQAAQTQRAGKQRTLRPRVQKVATPKNTRKAGKPVPGAAVEASIAALDEIGKSFPEVHKHLAKNPRILALLKASEKRAISSFPSLFPEPCQVLSIF